MIKWITENIGSAAFEDVVENPSIHILDVRDMVDKNGNSNEDIEYKVQEALSYLNNGKKIVICCDYGISRSNSIAAAIISKKMNISFNTAVRIVIKNIKEKELELSVLSSVRKAITDKEALNKRDTSKIKNILITGGSGFIGTALIERLKKNYNIIAPNHSELDLLYEKVELDLQIKENNIDLIIHLAKPHNFTTNVTLGQSITMLKNILEVCKENKLKLVYTSGWEIYSGYNSNGLLASENLACFPSNTYGELQYLSEILISHYHKLYDLKYLILRSSPIYGINSNKPKFIYNFLEKALKNEIIIAHEYLNGYPQLDLIHINDFVDIFETIIMKNCNGSYNIGSGVGVSTTKVAELIIELLNSKSKITHRKINSYVSNIVMDFSKARKEFNWNPKITIKQGLEDIIFKFKNLTKI